MFKLINAINESCKIFFSESMFCLDAKSNYRFVISGNYLTKAINNYNNSKEQVNVLKWFDDFWLYIEINFIEIEFERNLRDGINKEDYLKRLSENYLCIEKNYYETTISLSVFQGRATDDIKSQLFRAEWDNFVKSGNHPQPHWHIYPNYSLEKIFNDIIEMSDEGNSFVELLSEEKSKGIDLNRVHFAMNGNWDINGSHIHKISDEDTIINWFQGLLGHIKYQLEYVK